MTGLTGPGCQPPVPSGVPSVTRLMFGPDEWVMLAPPPGTLAGLAERAVLPFLNESSSPPDGPVTFRPVPMANSQLGLAVLHARDNRTAVYCRRGDLGAEAASTLSLIACRSTAILVGSADRCGPPRTRVVTIDHGRWVSDRWAHPALHPLISRVAPPETTIYACACQVSPELADVLTALGNEQLRCLLARRASPPGRLKLAT